MTSGPDKTHLRIERKKTTRAQTSGVSGYFILEKGFNMCIGQKIKATPHDASINSHQAKLRLKD